MRNVSCKNAARALQSVILECSMPGVRDVYRQRLWSSVRHVTSPALGTAQRDDLPKPSVSGQSGSNGGQSDGRFVFSVTDSELAATASGPLIHPRAAAAYVMGRPFVLLDEAGSSTQAARARVTGGTHRGCSLLRRSGCVDGNADCSRRQRRRVVDAVAGEQYAAAFVAELFLPSTLFLRRAAGAPAIARDA